MIDIHRPTYFILNDPCDDATSLQDLPPSLTPSYLFDSDHKILFPHGASDKTGEYKIISAFGWLSTKILVFSWLTTICASRSAAKYYESLSFKLTDFPIPSFKEEERIKYEGFQSLDYVAVSKQHVQHMQEIETLFNTSTDVDDLQKKNGGTEEEEN